MELNFGGPYVRVASYPNLSKTNSVATDQDFAAIDTLPSGLIVLGRHIRVSVGLRAVSGTSAVTAEHYLKLGSTKVYTFTTGNLTDGRDISALAQFMLVGTAAASGSAAVACFGPPATWTGGGAAQHNITAQPVGAIATNGTLDIVLGVKFSGTGSTETIYQLSALVEVVA